MPNGLKYFLYVIRAIVLAVLGTVLLLNLYGIYMQVIFKSDYPTVIGLARYISEANYPDCSIKKNDYLITADFLGYDKEDVIIYEKTDKSFSIDKIAKKVNDNIHLVSNVEEPMDKELIIRGKVIYNFKGAGEYMSIVESPVGIVILAILIIIIYEVPRLISKSSSKKSIREKRF